MKGLAIASFILGIIGLLLSFVFGLGLLPSILAVVFGIIPLVKKILRPMAISGLFLGLLGILVSVSFLTQKPEDIIEQTMRKITQEREARPSRALLKEGKETVDVSANDLYNILNKFTGTRQDEEWEKYEGKYVKWEGSLRPFGGSPKISKAGVIVELAQKADYGYIWIRAIFNEEESDKLFKLKEDEIISFTGKLADMSISAMLTGYHFKVEDAKILQVKKSKKGKK